jgi:uncharacterized membrane protein
MAIVLPADEPPLIILILLLSSLSLCRAEVLVTCINQ